MPVVYSAHIVHLPCTEINTVCKQTEISSIWPTSPRSSIMCAQNDFRLYCTFGAKSCTNLASRLTLSPNGPKQASIWPMSPKKSLRCSQSYFPSACYIQRKPCTYLAPRLMTSPNGPKQASTSSTSLEFHWLCLKWCSKPKVCSSHTVHLSCAEINTISTRTETSFCLTYVTYEFHGVCPKRFPCMWYIQHKSCTYLVPRLTLSPNELKWASTWPTSPRSSIGCAQDNFWAYCMLGTNHASILRRD
jgi:hypothetical protein